MTPARWRVAAAGTALAVLLGTVNLIALVQSYWHARVVAYRYTDHAPVPGMGPIPDLTPWLPLTTDGLLLAALAVIYWRRTVNQAVTPAVLVGAGIAAVGVVGANLANAMPEVGGWIVAGWPALTVMVGDILVALFLPTLGQAWRAGAPAGDPVPAVAPVAPVAAAVTETPDEEPVDLTQVPWTGPPVGPVDDVPAVTPETPPVTPLRPVVSALGRPGGVSTTVDPEPGTGTAGERWTADDERLRRKIQGDIDAGGRFPTQTSLRRTDGLNADRARRILAKLVPAGAVAPAAAVTDYGATEQEA